MIVSQIDAYVSQDMLNKEDSVTQFVLKIKPMLMENVSAIMDFLFTMENAKLLLDVLSIVTMIKTQDAVFVMLDIELLEVNAVTINIVDLMVILNMVNATVMMDTSGS